MNLLTKNIYIYIYIYFFIYDKIFISLINIIYKYKYYINNIYCIVIGLSLVIIILVGNKL